MEVTLVINGSKKRYAVRPDQSLLSLLRDKGFSEVKCGCEAGDCGSCLVLVDGKSVNSCMVFAAAAEGRTITTVRGIGTQRAPHVIQEALAETGAVQCGYCTPGMVVAAFALLGREPDPGEREIREALDGSLCRCTGYEKIIDGIRLAAGRLQSGGNEQ